MSGQEDSPPAAASLSKNRAFLRLWLAQVVSHAGTAITRIALPLAAVLVLRATPAEMALLLLAARSLTCGSICSPGRGWTDGAGVPSESGQTSAAPSSWAPSPRRRCSAT
jgi:hypothetical protein